MALLLLSAVALLLITAPASAWTQQPSQRFTLYVDDSTLLTDGSASLPPLVSVPCSPLLKEIVKPPSVEALYEWYVDTINTPDADPSWAVVWPTAVTLANYLLQNPALVKGKHIAELGCGLALVGLTAAALGAAQVTVTDREPYSLHCAMSSAAVNDLATVKAAVLDWNDADTMSAEVVLASDVLYDVGSIQAFANACKKIAAPSGAVILVADPKTERTPGARNLLRDALESVIEIQDLPMASSHETLSAAATADGRDHERRMREPTLLIKCIL